MKFIVEQLGKAGERAGHFELRGFLSATPFPLFLTKGGCIPHLTKESIEHLEIEKHPLLIPFQHHCKQTNVINKWGKGVASFIGMAEHPIVVTVQDPSETTRSGYHQNKSISVWINSNRVFVTPSSFMESMSAMKPDLLVALCDGDTEQGCSNKRISKSVSKTLDFLEDCLDIKGAHACLSSASVIGAIEGGLDLKARTKCAKEIMAKNVDGFLLDGFHCNGPESGELRFESIRHVLADTISLLPKEKPRFYFGLAPPDLVFNLVREGVDIFDSSYPNFVTEEDCALVFPNYFQRLKDKDLLYPDASNSVTSQVGSYTISLECSSNRLQFTPIVSYCKCYTCRNFTRAYIHHLVMVKEMLGKVLLQLHNLHHYKMFFDSLQEAIKLDQVEEFKFLVVDSSKCGVES